MSAIDQVPDEKARAVLRRLHGEAGREYWKLLWKFLPYWIPMFRGKKLPWERLQQRHDDDYLATSPGGGMYCYLLARAVGAKRIVEFGTSFGVSTIWLALAVRDNGGGIGDRDRDDPGQGRQGAPQHRRGGVGRLRGHPRGKRRWRRCAESMRRWTFLLSDGFPQYALPVLQLVAPKMRRGAIVLNHNALAMKGDHADYVAYVRDPANGFVSSEHHPRRRVVRPRGPDQNRLHATVRQSS